MLAIPFGFFFAVAVKLHYTLDAVFLGRGNEYRISHAKYLLLCSDQTVSEIAGVCGYASQCSFNRNFKEISDITPSKYRKKFAVNTKTE